MDPVTHTLIGVGIANAFFRKRVGPEAVPILAIASNIPDIDVLVHLSGHPIAITMRRSFGHSLFALPVVSLVLALLLVRRYPRHNLGTLWALSLIGACGHVVFDLVNSFGVLLLWPLSSWRPEWSIVFIIDLILLGLLSFPLLVSLWPVGRLRVEGFSRMACAAAMAYVLFCAANRGYAAKILSREDHGGAEFSYVFPEPLGPHRWRGVLRQDNLYRLFLINTFSGRAELVDEIPTDVSDERVAAARRSKYGLWLDEFFKAPVWRGQKHEPSQESEVSAYDLRFRSLVLDHDRIFEFIFWVRPDGEVEKFGWAARRTSRL